VHDLVERAYAPWVAIVGRRPGPMNDDYAKHIAAGEVFVLDREGALAALCVLVAGADHLLLDNVAVAPERQGEGLGRVMVAFAEAGAKARGYRELRLFTHERMAANIALYAKLGFVETHRAVQDGFHRVFMAKRVG
jgi:GNAT superfamily N-acetyltransferase